MTSLTRVLRWLRGPWVAPDPAPDLSWLDRKDGLDTRRPAPLPWRPCEARATLRAEGSRYDAQWPDVRAAETPGDPDVLPGLADVVAWLDEHRAEPHMFGPYSTTNPLLDFPADQSGFTGWGEYEIEPWPVAVTINAAVSRLTTAIDAVHAFIADLPMVRAATAVAAVKPRGRHRQTDPLDLILADLRDLDGQP